MIEAAFETARRLFGLTFKPRQDVPLYHPDVRAWEVKDADGRHVGLFFGDYFARPSKHSGAWMTSLRDQEKLTGDIRPIVVNVMNFSKAAAGEADLVVVRRCPHAVPRIRSCAARAAVQRDLSAARRHRCRQRFRRIALAALRALAGGAGDAAEIRPCIAAPASRCRRPCSTGCWRRATSTRASRRWNMSPRLWSISICIRCDEADGARRHGFRARGAGAHRRCRRRSRCGTARRIFSTCSPAAATPPAYY